VQKIIEQEDKELVARPAKLPQVARSVRRDLRNERKERDAAATTLERPGHTDEFKRKKLFDFMKAAEDALSAFIVAEVPEAFSLVDLKSLEARGERLGRAWPLAVTALLQRVEQAAAEEVASHAANDSDQARVSPESIDGLERAAV
jgi:hypothetical protein